jgi:biotin operon repressor
MRALDLSPERTARVFSVLRALRGGDPVSVEVLARDLRVTGADIWIDVAMLRHQGCLIDDEDGWLRMVDDHLPDDLTDAALDALCQPNAHAPSKPRTVASVPTRGRSRCAA